MPVAASTFGPLPQADVLLITGTTLINDTLDDILAAARPEACKVVVGPTVGLVPDAYLRRGCDVLGSIRITDADAFLDVLAEGGSGYHFFGHSAQKIVLQARREDRWRESQSAMASSSAKAI